MEPEGVGMNATQERGQCNLKKKGKQAQKVRASPHHRRMIASSLMDSWLLYSGTREDAGKGDGYKRGNTLTPLQRPRLTLNSSINKSTHEGQGTFTRLDQTIQDISAPGILPYKMDSRRLGKVRVKLTRPTLSYPIRYHTKILPPLPPQLPLLQDEEKALSRNSDIAAMAACAAKLRKEGRSKRSVSTNKTIAHIREQDMGEDRGTNSIQPIQTQQSSDNLRSKHSPAAPVSLKAGTVNAIADIKYILRHIYKVKQGEPTTYTSIKPLATLSHKSSS